MIDTDHHRNNPCNEAFTKYTSENDPTLFIGVFSTKAAAGDNRDTVLTMSFNSNAAASTLVLAFIIQLCLFLDFKVFTVWRKQEPIFWMKRANYFTRRYLNLRR